MTRAEKDFERIKNNPKNVSKDKLVAVLKRFGCIIEEGGKGSHFGVTHKLVDRTLTIPSKKPIKVQYVKDCMELIEEVIELSKGQE